MENNNNNLQPQLRFPGFDEDWEVKRLGDIVKKVGSGSTPRGGHKIYTETGVPFIRSQNVFNDALYLEDVTYIPEEVNDTMKGSIVKPNDVLLNITGASIGRSCVVPNDFDRANVNQHVCIIRLNKAYNPRFLQPLLSSHKGKHLIYQGQTGSGREGINFASIRAFKIYFPSTSEQQKIANFLSTFDKQISLLEQKTEQLEAFKKGTMQQLFSQKLRFKEENGEDFPDWEERKLGDIATIKTGKSNREDSTLNAPYTFFDRSQDVRTSSRYLFDGEAIIVAGEGQSFSPKYFTGKFDLHQRTYCIMNFINVVGIFLYYNIEYNKYYFYRYSVGTTVKSLRLPIFNNMNINIPSLPEQKKIADCLNSIDQQIEDSRAQLEASKTYKKGLLQQLLV